MIISHEIRFLPDVQNLLNQWTGTEAVIYGLTLGHRHLKIDLVTDEGPLSKRMTVVCAQPRSIFGCLDWKDANMSVRRIGEDSDETPLVELLDERAGVRVVCEGVAILEISKP